ncbi:hypothetical protein DFH08DRAFT_825215 [Mycena albidolilacea]|uniref:Uncharacterized protein n=1 Tax=Mycena albidolilacea TaxID=1033008 RepID=A0AAD7E9I2_9AGAR|nr:hypothetical protein DFH08DRAFT_825215 [Mycena albidolilacea]
MVVGDVTMERSSPGGRRSVYAVFPLPQCKITMNSRTQFTSLSKVVKIITRYHSSHILRLARDLWLSIRTSHSREHRIGAAGPTCTLGVTNELSSTSPIIAGADSDARCNKSAAQRVNCASVVAPVEQMNEMPNLLSSRLNGTRVPSPTQASRGKVKNGLGEALIDVWAPPATQRVGSGKSAVVFGGAHVFIPYRLSTPPILVA